LNSIAQKSSYLDSISDLVVADMYKGEFKLAHQNVLLIVNSKDRYESAHGYYLQNLIFERDNEYMEAAQSCYKALELFQDLDDTLMISKTYNSIAVIYYDVRDRKRTMDYLYKAVDNLTANYHPRFGFDLGTYFHNLGNNYTSIFDERSDTVMLDSARYFYERADEFYGQSPEHINLEINRAYLYSSLCLVNALSHNKACFDHGNKGLIYFKERNDSTNQSLILFYYSLYFKGEGKYVEALAYSDSCLAIYPPHGSGEFLLDMYDKRVDLLTALGKSEEAVAYHELHDSLHSALRDPSEIGDLGLLEKKKEKNDLIKEQELEKERLLKQEETKKARLRWIITVSIGALLLVAFVLYGINKKRKKLRQSLESVNSEKINLQEELAMLQDEFSDSGKQKKHKTAPNVSHEYLLEEVNKDFEHSKMIISDESKVLTLTFLELLTTNFPGLTRLELRMCVYLVLGLNSKEIASLQNIEPASVDRRRTRLRKKFGLKRNQKISTFLMSLYHE
jgi:tetratricopeptide (TPR) repeat protein/DNA-binding CsgD family transcriptional regulator